MTTRTRRPRIDLASVARLTEIADYIVPFTIRVICDLRLADHLTDGPRAVHDLAVRTGTHAPSLHRALRALAAKGVFAETEPGTFAMTPLAEPLRSDHPLSLADAYPLLAADIEAWGAFDHSIRTGEASFDHVHGRSYWDHMAAEPHDSARFDASQQAATRLEVRAVAGAWDWSSLGTLVDVGGGNGAFLAGLLRRHRTLRGVVFDLPHVVSGAAAVLDEAGVADRCEVVGGSFFDAVPAGHPGYTMKRILYGWDDDDACRLLSSVRAAMAPDSRLLVVEPVVQPGNGYEVGKTYDLLLFAMAGGGARSEPHLRELFGRAGLRIASITPTVMFPVIEVVPA